MAVSSDTWTTLVSNLEFCKCCECGTLPKVPQILPCKHTICQECKQGWPPDSDLVCPSCEYPVKAASNAKSNSFLVLMFILLKLNTNEQLCMTCATNICSHVCLSCPDEKYTAICSTCIKGHTSFTKGHQTLTVAEFSERMESSECKTNETLSMTDIQSTIEQAIMKETELEEEINRLEKMKDTVLADTEQMENNIQKHQAIVQEQWENQMKGLLKEADTAVNLHLSYIEAVILTLTELLHDTNVARNQAQRLVAFPSIKAQTRVKPILEKYTKSSMPKFPQSWLTHSYQPCHSEEIDQLMVRLKGSFLELKYQEAIGFSPQCIEFCYLPALDVFYVAVSGDGIYRVSKEGRAHVSPEDSNALCMQPNGQVMYSWNKVQNKINVFKLNNSGHAFWEKSFRIGRQIDVYSMCAADEGSLALNDIISGSILILKHPTTAPVEINLQEVGIKGRCVLYLTWSDEQCLYVTTKHSLALIDNMTKIKWEIPLEDPFYVNAIGSHVYVCQSGTNVITEFTSKGDHVREINCPGKLALGMYQLNDIQRLALFS